MNARLQLAVAVALVATVAAVPARAQSAPERAATAVSADLQPMSLVAATAALYFDRTGAYPRSTFELLGSPEAERTGLRSVQFSALTVGDASAAYRIADEGVESRTERAGELQFEHRPDSAQHVATFEIVARREAEAGGRRVPLAVEGDLEVRITQGRLCLDFARLAELGGPADFAAAAPNFGTRDALTVSFDGPGGRRVAAATLPEGR